MNGSVGQALRDARIAKKLSVEEVAQATKIRPERITDLEADDYMHFPNIVYARNFLILYSKYLGVDISRYPTLEIGFDTGVGEYSYLQQNEESAEPLRKKRRRVAVAPPEKPRWLIAFFVLLVALAAGALIGWGIMTIKRLGPVETAPRGASPTATPAIKAKPTPEAAPTAPTSATPAAMPGGEEKTGAKAPAEPVLRAVPVTGDEDVPSTSAAAPSPTVAAAVPAVPVAPAATPSPAPSVAAEPTPVTEGDEQEIAIRANRKIRLRVVRDDPKSPSVYHGSLNPMMKPLTFVGRHFWVKTADPSAVQVTIGGKPAPASVVEIVSTPGI